MYEFNEEQKNQGERVSNASSGSNGHTRKESSDSNTAASNSFSASPYKSVMAVAKDRSKLLYLSLAEWYHYMSNEGSYPLINDININEECWFEERSERSIGERMKYLMIEPSSKIKQLNFFHGIPYNKLVLLGLMLKSVYLRKGEILFEELQRGDSLYIVVEGELTAYVIQNGQERVLKTFHKNDMLGEMALIMNIPRTASIKAVKPSLLLELHKDSFSKFIKLVPSTTNLHTILKSRTAEHFRKYNIPFFESIPVDKYIKLAELCKIETVAPGTVVFREGDTGNCFYIIAHGELKVTVSTKKKSVASRDEDRGVVDSDGGIGMEEIKLVDTADEGEKELVRLKAGAYFGEIALVQDTPRTATVTAVTRSVLLSITQANFQLFFQDAPEAIADFEIKLARYSVRLRSVLYHPIGLEYFQQHLANEYSSENIEFWKECRKFRQMKREDGGGGKRVGVKNSGEIKQELVTFIQNKDKSPTPPPSTQLSEELAQLFQLMVCSNKKEMDVECFSQLLAMFGLHDIKSTSAGAVTKQLFSEVATGSESVTSQQFISYFNTLQSQLYSLPSSTNVDSLSPCVQYGYVFLLTLNALHLSALIHLFHTVDHDKSGSIELEEFIQIIDELGINISNTTPEQSSRDTAASVAYAQPPPPTPAPTSIHSIFAMIDGDMSGSITLLEFVSYMLGEQLSLQRFNHHLSERAHRIYTEYISESAERQVNIKGPTRRAIKDRVLSGQIDQHLFDTSEDEIINLMSADSFSRFKQSPLFEELLNKANAYNFKGTKTTQELTGKKMRSGSVKVNHGNSSNTLLTSLVEKTEQIRTRNSLIQAQEAAAQLSTVDEKPELHHRVSLPPPPPPPLEDDEFDEGAANPSTASVAKEGVMNGTHVYTFDDPDETDVEPPPPPPEETNSS